jgi:glycosyltransferase involved in cell wall biosynthesis
VPPGRDARRSLLVVVPAWNEQASVGHVIKEIGSACPQADVLVVDDGSTDATVRIAKQAGAAVLSLPYNLGVGGAMRAGFRYAERAGYRVVVQVDADGQHDPAAIQTLVDALDAPPGADVVVGARFAGEGAYKVGRARRTAMRLLAWMLSRITKTKLTDATSGFRATGPRALTLFARSYPTEYLGDTLESLVIAARSGCTCRQVPVVMRPRYAGTPSQSAWKSFAYLARAFLVLMLAAVRRWPLLSPEVAGGTSEEPAPEDPTTHRPHPAHKAQKGPP